MTELLDLIVLDVSTWLYVLSLLSVIIVLPRLIGLNYLNGLIFAQITLFFNSATIVSGFQSGNIEFGRAVHFFAVEFGFYLSALFAYSQLLKNKGRVMAALKRLLAGRGAVYLTIFVSANAAFNFLITPTDGSSRIGYMTSTWFSALKPVIQIITPLSYFGVFLLLLNPSRKISGYLLLLAAITANVLTGSKASFAFSLFISYLALRDLSNSDDFRIQTPDKCKLTFFACAMVAIALYRLEVSLTDLSNRFLLFGEATILTYFSSTPNSACEGVSTFAAMHRGLARILGDSIATDIDTLFGFALMIDTFGTNTLTGPNARISAYVLCNFADERIFFAVFVVAGYFAFLLWLNRRLLPRPTLLAVAYPFLLVSLTGGSQDFNLIMQDITIFILLLFTTTLIQPIRRRQLG